VIDRFRSLPMARSAVLAGRTLADLLRSAFVLALQLGAGIVLGFRWQTSLVGLAAAGGLALVFGYACSWITATIGPGRQEPGSHPGRRLHSRLPAHPAQLGVPAHPDHARWLQAFADHQPVTAVANALRGLTLGEGALAPGQTVTGQTVLALAWTVGVIAVFAPLAVRVYRRSIS
jgi:hypothetical protein